MKSKDQKRHNSVINNNDELDIQTLLYTLDYETMYQALKYHEGIEEYEMCKKIKEELDRMKDLKPKGGL